MVTKDRIKKVSLEIATADPRLAVIKDLENQLKEFKGGEAGALSPEKGETITTLRRRLHDAGRNLGMSLQVRIEDNKLYFVVLRAKRKYEKQVKIEVPAIASTTEHKRGRGRPKKMIS